MLFFYIFSLPSQPFNTPYSTVVVDRNGELLGARIANDNQWRFPTSKKVSEKFKTCLVEYEDQYFYYHWGVNPGAVFRAVRQNMKAKKIVSGGSTLTMQTVRLWRNEKRTWFEKIKEIILATRLEFSYSKKNILALYASQAPFGGNVVGLEAAAWRYFGHSSLDLSWAEAATLAVLPNAPGIINPSKNRSVLLKKRNRLLKKLWKKGKIDEITYELSLEEPLPEEPLPLPQIASHVVTYCSKIYSGIYSQVAINKELQLQMEETVARWNHEFMRNDIRNLAAIVIDVEKNEVVAYCGNVYSAQKKSANDVDIIRSRRSTGSILKPFLYCAMLQEGDLLPDMLLPDIPMNMNGFMPQNFNRQFDGAAPASEALIRSLNIPFVFALREYSVPKFYNFLKKAGFQNLNQASSHYGLSLILGGAEATLWDITSTYNAMAKTLNYFNAQEKYNGKTLEHPKILLNEKFEPSQHDKFYDAGAIWQTFNVLKEVNRPDEIDWRSISSVQNVAWKTGTSYGFRDGWAVGVTSKYVVGVWAGNANGEGKPELTGAKTAGMVLFDIFNLLPKAKWFSTPYKALTEIDICSQSGCAKGIDCPQTKKQLVCPTEKELKMCPYHKLINVTEEGKYRIYKNCEDENSRQEYYFVLPPSQEAFYKLKHVDYKMLPPIFPGCGQGEAMSMQFIYPQSNSVISLPKQLNGEKGEIVFNLAHNSNNATVFWHLDEKFLTSTTYFHQLALSPSPGQHILVVVDSEGNTTNISFVVKENE